MKTFKQLMEGGIVDIENVTVNTYSYQGSHGKLPKGTGNWAFSYERSGASPFDFGVMPLNKAIELAKKKAASEDKNTIYVLG